jgi:Tol biopolymer transport system component
MMRVLPLSIVRLGTITWSVTGSLIVIVSLVGQALPRGGQLALLSGAGELHLLDVGRRIEHSIFRGPLYISYFDWSPDGSRIAFVAHRLEDGGIHIYVLEIKTRQVHRVTNVSAAYISVAWSPDGSQLAFESDHEGDEEIYVADNLDCLDVCEGTVRRITHDTLYRDFAPVWSPDGSHLVFVSALLNGRSEVHSIGVNGGGPHSLTYRVQLGGSPAWSPDGRKLVLPIVAGDTHELYLMDAGCIPAGDLSETSVAERCERTLRNLTAHPDADWYPVWSPDSQEIIFLTFRDFNPEIYRMTVDTREMQRLTNNLAEDSRPDWSPDGQWITFVSDRDGGYDVYVMDNNGENLLRLTYSGMNSLPAWRP